MSSFFQLFRKTASRVYKRKGDDDGELHPLQEVCDKYSSSCYNLYQVSVGKTFQFLFKIMLRDYCDRFTMIKRFTCCITFAQRETQMS